MGENCRVDSGPEPLVRDNPRHTHPALPSRPFAASKHRNGSNVNINSQTPVAPLSVMFSPMIFSVTTDLKRPAHPPLSCLARLGPLSEVKITSVFSMIWMVECEREYKDFYSQSGFSKTVFVMIQMQISLQDQRW